MGLSTSQPVSRAPCYRLRMAKKPPVAPKPPATHFETVPLAIVKAITADTPAKPRVRLVLRRSSVGR